MAHCRQFYQFYSPSILQQPVAELENEIISIGQQAVAQFETVKNNTIEKEGADKSMKYFLVQKKANEK